MTEYARKNLDECTLSFTYRRVNMKLHGEFHKDVFHRSNIAVYEKLPEYDGERSISVIDNAKELQHRKEQFAKSFEEFQATSKTFPEIASVYMKNKKWNAVIFKEKTLLDDATYSRIINNAEKNWTFETIMAVAVGLGVNQETARRMLEAAGHTFGVSRKHQVYVYVLSDFNGIDEVNTFLESVDVKPLGNRPRKGS